MTGQSQINFGAVGIGNPQNMTVRWQSLAAGKFVPPDGSSWPK
jgi:hypothetical protein